MLQQHYSTWTNSNMFWNSCCFSKSERLCVCLVAWFVCWTQPHDWRDKVSVVVGGCIQSSPLLTAKLQSLFVFVDWSKCLWSPQIILHCFVILSSPQVLTDRIGGFIRFTLFYCQLAIWRILLFSQISRPEYTLGCAAGLLARQCKSAFVFENELPQQAGGVSFPPGLLFETVRWILNTFETWLEQKQLLLCTSQVWGRL